VFSDELFDRVNLRDIFPTAPVKRFHECRQADVINDRLPIKWKLKVAKTFADNSGDVILLWQEHRTRNRHPELARQRVVEKLVVSRPPEWIIDNNCAFEGHALQSGPVKRHFVRNTV